MLSAKPAPSNSPSSMPVYFIRHGETKNNVLKLFSGHSDTPLTKRGKEQALKAAKGVEKLNISLIISSPLGRAVKTAEIVADDIGYPRTGIILDERIAEHNLGSLSGTPWRVISSEEFSKFEGVESVADFRARLLDFLNEYKNTDEGILIVSHGGAYRMIESARMGMAPDEFHSVERPPNASYVELDLSWL